MRKLEDNYYDKFRCQSRLEDSICLSNKSDRNEFGKIPLWRCEICYFLICTKCLNPYREELMRKKLEFEEQGIEQKRFDLSVLEQAYTSIFL